MVMDESVTGGGVVLETVSAAVAVTPLSAAVMVAEPAVTPVAKPAVLMVATAALEELHVTVDVITAVEPSL
jgi:hypothetical protein